jgi:hypothetical protein
MGWRWTLWWGVLGIAMVAAGAVKPAMAGDQNCLKLAHDKDEFEVKSFISSDPCVRRYTMKRVLASTYEASGNFTEARRWYQLALDQLTKEGFENNLGPSSQKLLSREGNEVVWRQVSLTDDQKRDAVSREKALLQHLIAELDRRSGPNP